MMKKLMVIGFFALALGAFAPNAATLFAQAGGRQSQVEVSFQFTRQTGFATNQFAVWIEDTAGNHVRTLYATRFTATGGHMRRELSLPQWVKASNIAWIQSDVVDTFTGPTPRSSNLRYVWDGRDMEGTMLSGEFRVRIEGTLRNENAVNFTSPIRLWQAGRVTVPPTFSGPSSAERGMINTVIVAVIP